MAIAFVNGAKNDSAAGVATLTTSYTPVNGNLVVVFFATTASSSAATVKDNNNVQLTAGPTITNTVALYSFYYTAVGSPTSFIAAWTTARNVAMAVLEYSGCNAASVNNNLATKTATGTSAAPSITPTTQEANDFIVACLANGASDTITVATGNSREQVILSTARLLAGDNTAASATTVTFSGTQTSSAWAAVALEIRTVYSETLADTNTITDQLSTGRGNSVTDTLTASDAFSWAYLLKETVADQMTITDGSGSVGKMDLLIAIACPHLGQNWLDAAIERIGLVGIFADDNGGNWQDVLGIGYGDLINDQIILTDSYSQSLQSTLLPLTLNLSDNEGTNWADFMAAGYGNTLNDQLVLTESIGSGYGDVLSDSLTLSDILRIGYGDIISDQITMADFNGLGYGLQVNDQIVLTDVTPVTTFDFQLAIACPHLGANWLDAFVDQLLAGGLTLNLSDNEGPNWNDRLGVGYGNVFNDQTIFADSIGAGYGAGLTDQIVLTDSESALMGLLKAFTDQLVLTDFLAAGYGNVFNDQLVITDSIGAGYAALLNDSLNNWADAFSSAMVLGYSFNDQLVFLDFVAAGYGNIFNDQLIFTESLNAGYAALLNDTMVLTDSEVNVLGDLFKLADTLSMSDFLAAGYGNVFNDQLILAESIGAGYGAILSDSDSFWTDSFAFSFGGGLSESLFDTLVFSDFAQLGYGNATSDQIVLADSISSGYATLLSDQLVFTDSFADLLGLLEVLSDNDGTNWNDALRIGYGDLITDQLTMTDFTAAGYGSATSDQMVITDSISSGYGDVLSDQLIMSDSFKDTMGLNEVLTDADNSWADFAAIGYGLSTTDQLVIADSMSVGYGLLISDNDNFWTEAFNFSTGGGLSFQFADTLTMLDFLAAGYGNATRDQLILLESVGMGYGGLFTDQLVLNDSLTRTMGILEAFTDALTASDFMGLGYGSSINDAFGMTDFALIGFGLLFSDQTIFADSLNSGYSAGLSDQLVLSDSFIDVLGLNKALSDSDTTWLDFVGVGYGLANSDQLVLADSLSAGYGLLIRDNDNFWTDQFDFSSGGGLAFQFADDLVMSDFMQAGYGMLHKDQLILVDSLNTGYAALLSDLMSMSDSFADRIGLLEILSDDLNNWQDFVPAFTAEIDIMIGDNGAFWADAIDFSTGGHIDFNLSDSLSMLDFMGLGYGALTSDQLIGVDSLSIGYGSIVSDHIVLSDSETLALGLLEILSDDGGSNWQEFVPAFSSEIDIRITELMLMADAFSDIFFSGNLQVSLTDNLAFGDSLGIGYGFRINDSTMFWQESFVEQLNSGSNLISMIFADSMLLQDKFESLFKGSVRPAIAYKIGARLAVLLNRLDVKNAVNLYKVASRQAVQAENVFSQDAIRAYKVASRLSLVIGGGVQIIN